MATGKLKYKINDMINAINATKGMVYVAADKLGCDPVTIYNYAKKYPEVQAAIDAQRGRMVDTAELALWKALQNGEGWAISLTLKTIGRERGYVEKLIIEGNIELALINRVVKAAEAAGVDASEVFNAIIAELAAVGANSETGN